MKKNEEPFLLCDKVQGIKPTPAEDDMLARKYNDLLNMVKNRQVSRDEVQAILARDYLPRLQNAIGKFNKFELFHCQKFSFDEWLSYQNESEESREKFLEDKHTARSFLWVESLSGKVNSAETRECNNFIRLRIWAIDRPEIIDLVERSTGMSGGKKESLKRRLDWLKSQYDYIPKRLGYNWIKAYGRI